MVKIPIGHWPFPIKFEYLCCTQCLNFVCRSEGAELCGGPEVVGVE